MTGVSGMEKTASELGESAKKTGHRSKVIIIVVAVLMVVLVIAGAAGIYAVMKVHPMFQAKLLIYTCGIWQITIMGHFVR